MLKKFLYLFLTVIFISISYAKANDTDTESLDSLSELYSLYKDGIINKETFQKSKKRILKIEDEKLATEFLEHCPGSPLKTESNLIPSSWNNCEGIHILTDKGIEGNKYVGEFKNGKRHGQGTYYNLADNEFKGGKYLGEYKDGIADGQGTYTFANGNKYVGEFKNGKRNGQGTFYNLNDNEYKGDIYEGEYKDDKVNGQGTYYFLADNEYKGDKYVGELTDEGSNGQGTYFFADGRVWDGQWKNWIWQSGKKYAKGKYNGSVLADNECPGSPFKGSYTEWPYWDDCIGKVISTDEETKGNVLEGEFKNGQINGTATAYYSDGGVYKGQWINNQINGQGTHNLANGDEYVGKWKDGKRDGQGAYFFADGRVYVGQFKDNKCPDCKKYAKGEYNGSVVAENNNRQNAQNQEALERERRKREQAERELAELKAEKKKEKKLISSDIDPPLIVITSTNVEDKQGTIKGKVSDNIEVAELTIDGRKVNFSNSGTFAHNLFIPQDGIKISIEATDNSGLTTKEIITLERNETLQNNVLSFTKLNPLNIKGKKNKNSIALIIGISKYNNAPEAKYADRDANYFSDFSESVLGINKSNIKLISNNSANNTALKKALKIWLKGYSTPNQSDIYIFFAGHGLASNDGKELYLLPYDGEPRLLEDTALLRSEIFDTVKSINPKSVTVFLDACYSGQTREKDMILADARPIAIVPVESTVPENFTVFSASSGSEISGSLPEADHGLFSYFLMKGLEGDADANNDKKITNGELHSYVRSNVTRQAIRLGREQTPQLQGDENRVLVEFY